MSEEIKTYKVPIAGNEATFRISKMEDIFDERDGEADVPHRHDYYTVLVIKKSSGDHFVDFTRYELSEYQIHFVSPGQVHQIIESSRTIGYAMIFSEEFLIQNNISNLFIEEVNLFHEYGKTPPLSMSKEQFEPFYAITESIEKYANSSKMYKDQAIGSLLRLFLIESHEFCLENTNNLEIQFQTTSLLKQFKELLNEQYQKTHSSKDYAAQLHITADHLNKSIKLVTGKTAKELIQAKVTTEAKRLLYFSDLTNKEIAFDLGFQEPSHFSSFFKNCTGESPSSYRKNK